VRVRFRGAAAGSWREPVSGAVTVVGVSATMHVTVMFPVAGIVTCIEELVPAAPPLQE